MLIPLAFILVCIVVELTPGPNMVYLVVLTAREGRWAGFSATLGVCPWFVDRCRSRGVRVGSYHCDVTLALRSASMGRRAVSAVACMGRPAGCESLGHEGYCTGTSLFQIPSPGIHRQRIEPEGRAVLRRGHSDVCRRQPS